jgi:oxygen-dependent protoporphyrinogen oxidase
VLHTGGPPLTADGVVLAVPAGVACNLLGPIEPEAAQALGSLEYASVTVVTLSYPDGALPGSLHGTGLLVPAVSGPLGGDDGTPLVTACTFLTRKWPHLKQPGSELLRASVGRFGDDRAAALDDGALTDRVVAEVARMVGVRGDPTASSVTRWPVCLPQYRVHHLLRVASVEAALRRHPPLAVAGAAYRGVGIPACVASGRAAAGRVLEALAAVAASGAVHTNGAARVNGSGPSP